MFDYLYTKTSLFILLISVATSVNADDTKIITRSAPPPPPKILFLMDNSKSMDEAVAGDSLSRSRLQILKDTFSQILDSMNQQIKVGLTYYGGDAYKERGIAMPVSDLASDATTLLTSNLLQNDSSLTPAITNDGDHLGMFDLSMDNLPDPSSPTETVKDYLKQIVNGWTARGRTPIPSSILEVVHYFKGEQPEFGQLIPSSIYAAHPSTYSGSNFVTRQSNPGGMYFVPRPDAGAVSCHLVDAVHRNQTVPTNHTDAATYTFSSSDVASCLADGSCSSYCTANTPSAADIQAALDAHAVALANFSPTKKECTVDDGSCGTNCISKGSTNEPLYSCDSLPPGYTPPATTYTCSQYYHCQGQPYDTWPGTYNATYKSPITDECDSSFLVLLSDGEPQYASGYKDNRTWRIKNYLSLASCAAVPGASSSNTLSHGECGPELAFHLANTDLNTTLPGDQIVNTYTIGFGVSTGSAAERYLKLLARRGDGRYFSADNADRLTTVFRNLLQDVLQRGALSLAGAGYSVNASTRISQNNDVFIPVMKKIDGEPQWAGNLKKFGISNGVIVDSNGHRATRQDGLLSASARDLWSTQSNVDPVLSGGAASLLDPAHRKLFTDISGTTTSTGNKGSLGTTLQEIRASNSAITRTHLSVATQTYRNELLDYIRGYAIPVAGNKACTDLNANTMVDTGNCAPRLHMGDILHSKPVVISYDDSDSTKRYVVFGTNEGYLHAINADDGSEKFAFMPQSLLQNIDILYRNDANDSHPYGVDGSVSVWRHDANHDGKIKVADGDFVYIYFGLRRGGREYYALNITDPDTPKLLWKISNNTSGYSQLGQTWSKPLLAKAKYKTTLTGTAVEKMIMVVGAGYDPSVDEESRLLRPKDSSNHEHHQMGKAVYMIDAQTGSLVSSIDLSTIQGSGTGKMHYSIPGDIRVLDLNHDGYMDRFYFADTGGNIWRTDLFGHSADPQILHPETYLFAELGEDVPGNSLDTRKFYHEPEVSLFTSQGVSRLMVTIGSGYHAQPLNTDIQDRFYVLMDQNVYNIPSTTPAAITQSDLIDRDSLSSSITANTNNKLGWYYDLGSGGEKVLSSPIILLNKVFFTTFKPRHGGSGNSSCASVNSHKTRLYAFNLLNGSAALDFDNDGTKDTFKKLREKFILNTPTLFFREPDCNSQHNCERIVDIKTSIAPPMLNSTTNPGRATRGTASSSVDIGDFTPQIFWLNPNH